MMEEQNSRENAEETKENETLNNGAEVAAGDPPAEEEGKEKGSLMDDILEIAESVIISVFVVLLLFTFIARPVTVDGRSMFPTLENEDKLVMRTFLYSPDVGDIVIIDNNASYTYKEGTNEIVKGSSLEKRLIKRVIALGGQTVDIDFNTGVVKVDGKVLEEKYIADDTHVDPGAFSYPVTVPEGYIFVMGDNRNKSTDSRDNHVGFVKEEDVLGEAVLRFYPFDKFKLLD